MLSQYDKKNLQVREYKDVKVQREKKKAKRTRIIELRK